MPGEDAFLSQNPLIFEGLVAGVYVRRANHHPLAGRLKRFSPVRAAQAGATDYCPDDPNTSACRSHRVGPDAGMSTAVSLSGATRSGPAGACGGTPFVVAGASRAVVVPPADWRSNSARQRGQRPDFFLGLAGTRKLVLQDGQEMRVWATIKPPSALH